MMIVTIKNTHEPSKRWRALCRSKAKLLNMAEDERVFHYEVKVL